MSRPTTPHTPACRRAWESLKAKKTVPELAAELGIHHESARAYVDALSKSKMIKIVGTGARNRLSGPSPWLWQATGAGPDARLIPLRPGQRALLDTLTMHGPTTIEDLAGHMGVAYVTMVERVAKLSDAGRIHPCGFGERKPGSHGSPPRLWTVTTTAHSN